MPEQDDAALEWELRETAADLDPVPAHLLRHAEAAFTWRTVDADLAALAFDSATEPAAVVRGADRPRLLTFQAGDLSIEVEVTGAGTHTAGMLVGQLVPAQAAEIEMQYGDRTLTVAADPFGRFVASPPERRPLRLRCRLAGGSTRPVVTDWFAV